MLPDKKRCDELERLKQKVSEYIGEAQRWRRVAMREAEAR